MKKVDRLVYVCLCYHLLCWISGWLVHAYIHASDDFKMIWCTPWAPYLHEQLRWYPSFLQVSPTSCRSLLTNPATATSDERFAFFCLLLCFAGGVVVYTSSVCRRRCNRTEQKNRTYIQTTFLYKLLLFPYEYIYMYERYTAVVYIFNTWYIYNNIKNIDY